MGLMEHSNCDREAVKILVDEVGITAKQLANYLSSPRADQDQFSKDILEDAGHFAYDLFRSQDDSPMVALAFTFKLGFGAKE